MKISRLARGKVAQAGTNPLKPTSRKAMPMVMPPTHQRVMAADRRKPRTIQVMDGMSRYSRLTIR